jgi:hypothetical protein
MFNECRLRGAKMIETRGYRRQDHRAVVAILVWIQMDISQPAQEQGAVIAAQQFLADFDELVNETLAFFHPPPPAFLVAFPPNNHPVADFLARQCVLVSFAWPEIRLDHPPGERAFG